MPVAELVNILGAVTLTYLLEMDFFRDGARGGSDGGDS
jgi:hypothetical protein